MRVLVVDDYEDICRPLVTLLKGAGFEASYVLSGQEAINSIAANPPEWVLLDWMLPDLDGLSVLRSIRSDGFTGTVAMLTAINEDERRLEAMAVGADLYWVKTNIRFDDIVTSIRSTV